MDARQPGSEQEEPECRESEPNGERDGGPGEEERGRGVVIALIGERATIPLVPFVTQTTIYIYMYELSAGTLGLWGEDS